MDVVERPVLVREDILVRIDVAVSSCRVKVEQSHQELAPSDFVIEPEMLFRLTREGCDCTVGTEPDTGGDRLGKERSFGLFAIGVEVILKVYIEFDAGGEQVWIFLGRLALDKEQAGGKQTGADLAWLLGLSALTYGN